MPVMKYRAARAAVFALIAVVAAYAIGLVFAPETMTIEVVRYKATATALGTQNLDSHHLCADGSNPPSQFDTYDDILNATDEEIAATCADHGGYNLRDSPTPGTIPTDCWVTVEGDSSNLRNQLADAAASLANWSCRHQSVPNNSITTGYDVHLNDVTYGASTSVAGTAVTKRTLADDARSMTPAAIPIGVLALVVGFVLPVTTNGFLDRFLPAPDESRSSSGRDDAKDDSLPL